MYRLVCQILTVLGLMVCAGVSSAQQPTQAQASAIRSACRGDYMSVCSGVPTGGMPALQCLEEHAGQTSPGCQKALAAVKPPQSPPVVAQAAPAAEPLPPPRPMTMREEVRLLRADCGSDYQRFCSAVEPGGGRGLACLHAHGADLKPACRSALRAAAQG